MPAFGVKRTLTFSFQGLLVCHGAPLAYTLSFKQRAFHPTLDDGRAKALASRLR
jgi:hypothetical protein